jgi:2-phospho-L-lactate guanylyltransferase (CobY/MobA/RfbA family)
LSVPISAVVLAGGKAKPEIVAATGQENRALIPIDGRPMLSYVVDALRQAQSIGEVIVVGDLPADPSYTGLPDTHDFAGNLFGGLERAAGSDYTLISTVDIPFITGEVVEDFVTQARAFGADIVYPVVHVEACYKRFPGVKRTAWPLKDGKFTGGNMVLARTEFMLSHRQRIVEAYEARKAPLRLAMMLGLGTVFRAVGALKVNPNLLSVGQLERAVGRLLGGTAKAYVSPYPEIATDIDKPSDLAAIEGAVGSGETGKRGNGETGK